MPTLKNVKRKPISLGTVLLIPLAFLVKDIVATMAFLSREPGITEQDGFYFAIASLPGTLFVPTAYAMTVNLCIGGMTGVIVFVAGKIYSKQSP